MKRLGRCLCEAVSFEIEEDFLAVTHCHCGQCRRHHGAAFSSHGGVPEDRVTVKDPAAVLRDYRSGAVVRSFCSRCGSSLFWRSDRYPGHLEVAIGALDDGPGLEAVAHIHVQSKASWHRITDDLEQFPDGPSWG